MDQIKGKLQRILAALPPGQRVTAIAGIGVFLIAAVVFARWVGAPSYSVLYSGLDDKRLSKVIAQLDAGGVPYKIEAGGSRVLVPQSQVYTARASLAEAGVGGAAAPAGYELLDGNELASSDFKQQVDYKRAVEGELAKTLMAMDGIDGATVHLALAEQSPFDDDEPDTSASVLVDAPRALSRSQVDTIVFVVSSSVTGLDPSAVTVADSAGRVLAAPGGESAGGDRTLEMTRQYEAGLTADVQRLLATVPGGDGASVVVRAQLDFDQTSSERESYDPTQQVAVTERTTSEQLTGGDAIPAGVPGASGQSLGSSDGSVNYTKEEQSREFGVTREVTRTVKAPGAIQKLSIAVVMGAGAPDKAAAVPPPADVEDLIAKAVGLDATRGDTIKVSQVAQAAASDAAAGGGASPLAQVPQAGGALVMLIVAIVFVMMIRKRGGKQAEQLEMAFQRMEALPAGAGAPAVAAGGSAPGALMSASPDVRELVERQPEEIAATLRSWLADRRS